MGKPEIDFFVVGAARSGTTSVYKLLKRHPGVFVPEMKEPRFFSSNWSRGWDWYADIYAKAPLNGEKVGDLSPNYSNAIDAPGRVIPRLKKHYPDAKIVYMVRNPVVCAISNWRMTAHVLGKEIPFGEALTHEDWALACYHRVSFHRQLSMFREVYDDSQILVIPLEGMLSDPTQWIKKLCHHIEVSTSPFEEAQRVTGVRSLISFVKKQVGIEPKLMRFPMAGVSNLKPDRPAPPRISAPERQKFLDMVGGDALMMLKYLGLDPSFWSMDLDSKAWEPSSTFQRK